VARYRTKDDIDLRWNAIRRRITRELDTQIADWREQALNKLLAGAWTEYADAISNGRVLELETQYDQFVSQVLADVITIDAEADGTAD
jgi:hypothetical protein